MTVQIVWCFVFAAIGGIGGWALRGLFCEQTQWRREEAEEARRDRARTSREQQP